MGPVEQFHQREVIGDWAVELVTEMRREAHEREMERQRGEGQNMGGSARL